MARMVLYIPWTDDDALVNGAYLLSDWLERKGSCKEAVVIGPEHLSAAKIKKDEPVYICGECAAGIDFIGSKHGKTMTASQLAKDIKVGLSSEHQQIHIWACYSGFGMTEKKGLAYKFWHEMNGSFKKLAVFGYRLAVLDPLDRNQERLFAARTLPGFINMLDTPNKAEIVPGNASNWMTGIGPNGEVIPPLPLPRAI